MPPIAVGQLQMHSLTHPHRGQAPSHILIFIYQVDITPAPYMLFKSELAITQTTDMYSSSTKPQNPLPCPSCLLRQPQRLIHPHQTPINLHIQPVIPPP